MLAGDSAELPARAEARELSVAADVLFGDMPRRDGEPDGDLPDTKGALS